MRKRGICASVCLMLCLVILLPNAIENVKAVTSDSIKEKESQISDAQKEKENIKNSLTDIEKLIKQLEDEKSNLSQYVATLDQNLAVIEQNIATLKHQIQEKEEELIQIGEELDQAVLTEQKQYECMVRRIRYIYEEGEGYFLELFFSAESFGDVLGNEDYVASLYAYDQKMWEKYQLAREYVELCKRQLELEKSLLDDRKAVVEEEQQNLESLITEKGQEIKRYEGDINNKEKTVEEYKAEIAAQDEMIAAMEAAVAEERRKLLESNKSVLTYDNGPFKFPMASFTSISDEYGWRIHPILGVEQFHNGVDFAAPGGTAIYAAYDGVVVAASYSSTMGNYIMIDHGDSLYTIYMHASALYVSGDEVVVRGQTIAAVGSTGRSTGNHLHFGVRLNGSYVTPWNYLSQ